MNYENRENYPHAPLALVTVEVKLNYDPRANLSATRDEYGLALRETFPILAIENELSFSLQVPRAKPEQQLITHIRATDRARTTSVTLNANSLQLTMLGRQYQGYESFEPVLATCLNALEDVLPATGVERIGIRFLDEIRVSAPILEAADWGKWVNPGLVSPAAALGLGSATQLRGGAMFDAGDDSQVNFQWGDVRGRTVIADELPLEKPHYEESRFFVLDIDSAWQAPNYTVLGAQEILERTAKLHSPLGSIFQWAITDASREQFRGDAGA